MQTDIYLFGKGDMIEYELERRGLGSTSLSVVSCQFGTWCDNNSVWSTLVALY
jgi:hypothetical protein